MANRDVVADASDACDSIWMTAYVVLNVPCCFRLNGGRWFVVSVHTWLILILFCFVYMIVCESVCIRNGFFTQKWTLQKWITVLTMPQTPSSKRKNRFESWAIQMFSLKSSSPYKTIWNIHLNDTNIDTSCSFCLIVVLAIYRVRWCVSHSIYFLCLKFGGNVPFDSLVNKRVCVRVE